MTDGLWTPKQTADYLRVSVGQVRALAHAGLLPYINVGLGTKRPRMRFDPEDVRVFKQNQRKVGPACHPSTRVGKAHTIKPTSGLMVVSFADQQAQLRKAKRSDAQKS